MREQLLLTPPDQRADEEVGEAEVIQRLRGEAQRRHQVLNSQRRAEPQLPEQPCIVAGLLPQGARADADARVGEQRERREHGVVQDACVLALLRLELAREPLRLVRAPEAVEEPRLADERQSVRRVLAAALEQVQRAVALGAAQQRGGH